MTGAAGASGHHFIVWPTSEANQGRPLCGIKVLDLTRVLAGPFCAMLLGDLGADVVKVEAPRGDETRRWGPPFHRGTAAYYFGANRNKWGVVLDLEEPKDRASLVDLIRQADVVVQNFTDSTARKFGVDHDSVASVNPSAIHLSLWAAGPHDPERRGYDLIAQAMSGIMAITGEPDRDPVKVGVPIADLAAGLFGALAVTSALVDRSSGRGRRIDVSLYDAVLALLTNQSMSWLLCGHDTERHGADHPTVAPYGAYRAADGALILAVGTDAQFTELCGVLERPDLAADPRFRTNEDRVRDRSNLRASLEAALSARPVSEWEERFAEAGLPTARVRSVGDALDARETRTVASLAHPVWGHLRLVMDPIVIDGRPLAPYLAPPVLGEHNAKIVPGDGSPDPIRRTS